MSLSAIEARTARVVIVDATGIASEHITKALKRLGFSWFAPPMKSFKELEVYVKKTKVDWIISTLCENSNLDAITYFTSFYQNPEQATVCWSLVVDNVNPESLGRAFGRGVLSWHLNSANAGYFDKELKTLLQFIRKCNFKSEWVAANYYRTYCIQEKRWDQLLALEEILSVNSNGTLNNLMEHLRAAIYCQNDKKIEGLLSCIKHMEPARYPEATDYLKAQVKDYVTPSFAVKYGLGEALILADDSPQREHYHRLFQKIGFARVTYFAHENEAFKYIKSNPAVSCVLCSWDGHKKRSSILLQRLKAESSIDDPAIIVTAEKFSVNDLMLLKELNVSQVLKQPYTDQKLIMAIAWSMVQYREPNEIRTVESKIFEYFKTSRSHWGRVLKRRFCSLEYVSANRIAYVNALESYFDQDYAQALETLKASCDLEDRSNSALIAFLSALHFLNKDMTASVKHMRLACKMSPDNMLRLASLAALLVVSGETKEAGAILEQLKEWDPENPVFRAVDAAFWLVSEWPERIADRASIDAGLPILDARAVFLAENGEHAKAVSLWKKALSHSSVKNPVSHAVMSFNLALTLAKTGSLELGQLYVKNALAHPTDLLGRAKALSQALETKMFRDGAGMNLGSLDVGFAFGLPQSSMPKEHQFVSLRGIVREDGTFDVSSKAS
ncbi:MAG: hypothetical protein AB7T49_11570 [Oligoflexales bacterium]